MSEAERLALLLARHASLMQACFAQLERDAASLKASRERAAHSLALLSQTGHAARPQEAAVHRAVFGNLIAIAEQKVVLLASVADLIDYVRRTGQAPPLLRSETF